MTSARVEPITDEQQAKLYAFVEGTPHYDVVRTLYRAASEALSRAETAEAQLAEMRAEKDNARATIATATDMLLDQCEVSADLRAQLAALKASLGPVTPTETMADAARGVLQRPNWFTRSWKR